MWGYQNYDRTHYDVFNLIDMADIAKVLGSVIKLDVRLLLFYYVVQSAFCYEVAGVENRKGRAST